MQQPCMPSGAPSSWLRATLAGLETRREAFEVHSAYLEDCMNEAAAPPPKMEQRAH